MKAGGKMLAGAAGAVGVAVAGAAAGAAVRMAQQRRVIRHRTVEDAGFGTLRTEPITVVADDGLPLHVEVDEYAPRHRPQRRTLAEPPPVTVVFVHGYTLTMDTWHFQRAAFRGLVRAVYYDQRSHGRSGRANAESSTIEQLASDLVRVLEDVTHDEPVVLIGHSMGGMTIMELARQRPELFGTKIVGVGLVGTSAGGLDPARILFPILPAGLSSGVIGRVVGALSRGHRMVDRVRGVADDVALVVTDAFAFGDDVPESYLKFVYDMIDDTSFEVVAAFYPAFASLDLWDSLEPMSRVPTAIVCGTKDRLTSIEHARRLHATIAGSDLLECPGAGHLVPMERQEEVNSELEQLIDRAIDYVEREAS